MKLQYNTYHMIDAVKPWKRPTVVGSIIGVGILKCCELLLPVCNLKAIQINILAREYIVIIFSEEML